MAKQSVSAITALGPSPTDDRHSRMVKYLIAMSIRVVCILLCFFVQGWWLAVFAVGAIVLPYLAVVLANVGNEPGGTVLRPGAVVPVRQTPIVPNIPEDTIPEHSAPASAETDGDARAGDRSDDPRA